MAWLDRENPAWTQRRVTNAEQDVVAGIMRRFTEKTTWRNTYAGQLEETAALIWPEYRNTFFYGSYNWPGMKRTQQQVDSSGMLALNRGTAMVDSMLTPANQEWHGLEADDEYVNKDPATRLYFSQVTRLLFKHRRNPLANFRGQNSSRWRSIMAFGNATMLIDAFDGRQFQGYKGLRYKAVPLGETFFAENHQGIVVEVDRWFRLTAAQCKEKFGWLPPQMQAAYENGSLWPYDFVHAVRPNDNYDPKRLDERGLPFSSHYVCIAGQCLMAPPGGYSSFPYAVHRYDVAPREVYGRGPAQMVLPALKTLNAQKSVFLKQGHRAADPILLTADDGVTSANLIPGAMNKGGVTSDGKPLVHILPTGEIQIVKEMMAEERGIIDDMFLTSLLKTFSENPNMKATQVIELVNERGMLYAPTLGQQEPALALQIEREIDVLARQRMLPPMPPRLKEAKGAYQMVPTSPLALSQRANKAAGFMRVVETSKEIVNITQDPSYLDWANFDVALPAIARDQSVDEAWINTDKAVEAKRASRAKAQQQKAAIEALPNQAAMLNAQSKMAKAQPGVAPGQPGMGGPQQVAA